MSWYDSLTSTPALVAGAVGVAVVYISSRPKEVQAPAQPVKPAPSAVKPAPEPVKPASKMAQTSSIMSAPAVNLAPPKDDPISRGELSKFDGTDSTKPIYIAIKGRVFDVSNKKEMYGVGGGYHVFAGKDASKGLGMSSLDAKDAVPDFSGLDEKQRKTLDQWESFFEKRYNIVGKVKD